MTRVPMTLMTLFAIALLVAVPAPAERGAAPPEGKTYFTLVLGLAEDFEPFATCVEFDRDQICAGEEVCGRWTRTLGGVQSRRETSFSYLIEFVNEDGLPGELEGQGRVDDRGPRSTIGAVGRLRIDGQTLNFGFVGQPVKAGRCPELVAEFQATQDRR